MDNNQPIESQTILSILDKFEKISLEDMKEVKLMNRTDTKYVCTMSKFLTFLELIHDYYMVQSISGRMLMPYYTRYYDTPDCEMYRNHLHGKSTRKKIRVRRYVSSGVEFLEIKLKNNKGRTNKKRIDTLGLQDCRRREFIMSTAGYDADSLLPQIENNFTRLTLVNKRKTERVTVDFCLNFHNLVSDGRQRLDHVVIIELKRDGRVLSDLEPRLRQLRIKPSGFSKYCIGMALTNDSLPSNRFKERIRMISKMSD